MKNKKYFVTVVLCLAALNISACGRNKAESEISSETIAAEKNDITNANIEEETIEFDPVVKVDGSEYTLPINCEDLLADGWEMYSFTGEETIDPQSYAQVSFQRSDALIHTSLVNRSEEEEKLKNLKIESVWLSRDWYEEGGHHSVELPDGITILSTEEDIKKSYGEPTNEEEMQYINESGDCMSFSLKYNGECSYMEMNTCGDMDGLKNDTLDSAEYWDQIFGENME